MNTVAVIRLLLCFATLLVLLCPRAHAIHGEARKKLTEGYEAIRLADYARAHECFLEALKQARRQGESREAIDFLKVEVAENDARLGHPSRALTELNAIQKNYDLLAQREGHKSQWYNHLLRAKAFCYFKEGKYDSAILIFKQILQDEDKLDESGDAASDRATTRIAYAKILMMKGDHQETQNVLNELIASQADVDNDVVFQAEGMLAHSYFAQKKYAETQQHLQLALAIMEKKSYKNDPREGYLKLLLASVLEAQGKLAEAAPLLKEAEGLLTSAGRQLPIDFFEKYEKCLKSLAAGPELERVRKKIEELKNSDKAQRK